MRRRRLYQAVAFAFIVGAAVSALQCAPAEDTSVSIVTQCDLASLNLGDPAEATVKVYTETATQLRDRVDKLKARFTEVCNAINRDMGEPEGGDIHAACNKIAERVEAANNRAPTPPNGVRPVWVTINFDITCPLDAKTVATCTDQCSATKGCDPVATCPSDEQRSGTCAGQCAACSVTGDAVACKGACNGTCASNPALSPDAGLPACQGECRGTCNAPNWQGSCSAGCTSNFRGTCKGTCTGSCDGVAYPSPDGGAPVDAGDEAGDGGAGGGDAGGPPGSGQCDGICTGTCVGEASGSCGSNPPIPPAPCKGEFKGGLCPGNVPGPGGAPFCIGECVGVGVACTTTCTGTCSGAQAGCTGKCTGCDGPLANAECGAVPNCPDVNPICAGTCALQGALATTCAPSAVDIRVAGDYTLPTALKNHAADFSAVAREANLISANLGGVLQRTPAEFRAIGVERDNARFCAAEAPAAYEELRKSVNEAVGASLVVRGQKF